MNYAKLKKFVETEKLCVLRNIDGCDRDCVKCDLVMDDFVVVSMYDDLIQLLSQLQEQSTGGDNHRESNNVPVGTQTG